jgi:hypothetical protein
VLAARRRLIMVINMHYYRCDALLIKGARIYNIHLLNLEEVDINERLKDRDRRKRVDSI